MTVRTARSHLVAILLAAAPFAGLVSAHAQTAPKLDFAPLDGQVFEAGIVRQDDSVATGQPLADSLSFSNGMFSSKICERYGFVPAPYYVRGTKEAIEFTAVLHSPTDGMMAWSGRVKDGKLEGTMRWTRERWYWTIEAEHRIAGELSSARGQTEGAN